MQLGDKMLGMLIIFLSGLFSRITEAMTRIGLTWEMVSTFTLYETFSVKPETFIP